jgi:hypothetical protein
VVFGNLSLLELKYFPSYVFSELHASLQVAFHAK